jgi:hypothetical protein
MSIRKLRAGRVPGVTQSQYIGEKGSIFWNELTGEFRLSDGVTPGGSRVGFPIASPTEIGGIKLGPGTLLNNDGQLVIDSAGLSFNFGDFQATTPPDGSATLSSINTDQNIDIVSNGTGAINVVGDFHIHRTQDYDPLNPDYDGAVFAVKADGQIQMKVPLADIETAALEIIGNDTGLFLAPNQTGVILHVTGNSGLVSRNYFDANANYVILAGRRYNGTQLAPRRVLNNETLLRIVSQGATATNNSSDATFQPFGPARISFYANEDQTPTAQGGRIAFEVTKNGFVADGTGTNTITAAYIDAQNGVTAIKFNGPLTGNVTGKADTAGNADTVTNGVYTNGSYANPSWITSLAASKVGLGNVENTALSTSTHYIGTTSIQYNRASAAQTLSGVSISGNAGTVTNGVYTTDTGTVTNTMLSGSIANNKLVNTTIQVNGVTLTLGDTAKTITAAAGTLTGTTLNSTVVTSSLTSVGTLGSLTVTNDVYAGNLHGKLYRPVRDAGTIAAGGTLTIDFTADSIVYCTWGDGLNIAYQNYVAGRIVKVMAIKSAGTGTDSIGLDGVTAGQVSTGSTSLSATAGATVFMEFISTSTTVGGVFVKL